MLAESTVATRPMIWILIPAKDAMSNKAGISLPRWTYKQNPKKERHPLLPRMQGQRKPLTRIDEISTSMAMHVRQQTRPAKVHGVMPTLSRPMSRLQSRRPLRGHRIPTEEVLQSTVPEPRTLALIYVYIYMYFLFFSAETLSLRE